MPALPDPARLLVVAATARELAPPAGWRALACGVGPVDAAGATAAAIAIARPAAILHVGIAGARRAAGLAPGTLVIGASAHYDDLDVPERFAPRSLTTDAALLAAARAAFPEAVVTAIATSARVGGTRSAPVEAMEGFAVLRAAALAGVPALEVRAIANEVEEADRTRWQFDAAFAAITAATPRLVAVLRDALP
jgi:futalosine hydrolase